MGMTPKQEQFALEYLVDLNATQAAIRAGYSAKTANEQGARLLANVSVQEKVTELMQKRSNEVGLTSKQVLNEIGKLAFADIRKVFDKNGNLLPVHELPDEIAASISSIEVVTSKVPGGGPAEVEHTSKIKFWDKRGSLELLGRHLKLFTDKVSVGGDPDAPPIKTESTVTLTAEEAYKRMLNGV